MGRKQYVAADAFVGVALGVFVAGWGGSGTSMGRCFCAADRDGGREETPFRRAGDKLPFEFGAIVQGGVGLTEDRDGFKFLMREPMQARCCIRRCTGEAARELRVRGGVVSVLAVVYADGAAGQLHGDPNSTEINCTLFLMLAEPTAASR